MAKKKNIPLQEIIDLHNQGLSNVNITNNNGAAVDSNGKIGKCYSFNGNNQYIDTGYGNGINSKNISIALWIKPLSSLNNKIVIGMSAGAINMAKKVVLAKDPDDNILELSIYEGLGLTDINIEPHCDFSNKEHWKELEKASEINEIVVMNDDAYIICDDDISYYGTYLILKNKEIFVDNKKVSLEYFIEDVLNA